MTDKDQMTGLLLLVGSQSKKIEALMKRLCALEERIKTFAPKSSFVNCNVDLMSLPRTIDSMSQIVDQVSSLHCVSRADILGTSRVAKIICARQHCYTLARQGGKSFLAIGRFFNRDHTTVIYGIKAHEKRVAAS